MARIRPRHRMSWLGPRSALFRRSWSRLFTTLRAPWRACRYFQAQLACRPGQSYPPPQPGVLIFRPSASEPTVCLSIIASLPVHYCLSIVSLPVHYCLSIIACPLPPGSTRDEPAWGGGAASCFDRWQCTPRRPRLILLMVLHFLCHHAYSQKLAFLRAGQSTQCRPSHKCVGICMYCLTCHDCLVVLEGGPRGRGDASAEQSASAFSRSPTACMVRFKVAGSALSRVRTHKSTREPLAGGVCLFPNHRVQIHTHQPSNMLGKLC
jgi:hypothetical protein